MNTKGGKLISRPNVNLEEIKLNLVLCIQIYTCVIVWVPQSNECLFNYLFLFLSTY